MQHGGKHLAGKGERRDQAQRQMRRADVGLRHQDRVERGDEAGGDGHAVRAELAAHGVHDAGRENIEAEEHDPELEPEDNRV